MSAFESSLISVVVISLISLVGVFSLAIKENTIKKLSVFFVSFAAGALFGDAFIHLIPELYEGGASNTTSLLILAGIILFLIIEKFLHWRHCHVTDSHNHIHPMVTSNLIGDVFHNFLDGLLIASAFVLDPTVGFATTIAVILHEIPQEIGDFGIMIHNGIKINKALFMNFISALTAILGVLTFFALGEFVTNIELFLVPLTIGGFIYIAGSDLIPELKNESNLKISLFHILPLILGIAVMYSLVLFE